MLGRRMSSSSASSSTLAGSPRPSKRPRLDEACPLDFRDGVFLAPMVRSGTLPTRLIALAHGASLVWSPEIVDKAILNTTRTVDARTGVITYTNKNGASVFTTHPIERPYLIYQIGSADPELAYAAAMKVVDDVSGVDLNCGCPKPFSTHAGMGAALLSTPDLLCGILRRLREGLPRRVSVSAKIRLLEGQEETKELVKKIVGCGVSCVTVHCRTRAMRPRERALVERLKEIVEFVQGLEGGGVPVVANGDCAGIEDVGRVKAVTGASSVMIATAAESNPTCFSQFGPFDEASLIRKYIQLARYLGNSFGNSKHCVSQFKGDKRIRASMSSSKRYEDWDGGSWDGENIFEEEIKPAIRHCG